MVVARKWTMVNNIDGYPKNSDFKLVEEELAYLNDGEILIEAVYLSVDPYMRPYMDGSPLGSTIVGQQVAKILDSKHPDWSVGSLVLADVGWRSHTILEVSSATQQVDPQSVPVLQSVTAELDDLSKSLALGAVGMTGATAYFGIFEILQPKPGETLFVNSAAGAVGSVAGQIGKILGCRVIGCAGSKEKCNWLREIGFDYVFNYKEVDNSTALKEGAPDGVDCVFENVGGDFCETVIKDHMNVGGRMAVCGLIAEYNKSEADRSKEGAYSMKVILFKELKIQGFLVYNWIDKLQKALSDLCKWIKKGQIKTREHITVGFENMPAALLELFSGTNTGKAIVKA